MTKAKKPDYLTIQFNTQVADGDYESIRALTLMSGVKKAYEDPDKRIMVIEASPNQAKEIQTIEKLKGVVSVKPVDPLLKKLLRL